MYQHGNVSKSVSQHGMQTVNETLGMSNQTNSCHTLSQCRCSENEIAGPVKNKSRDSGAELFLNRFTGKSSSSGERNKARFWLTRWATVSLELPQNCLQHCGISGCQETFDMIFHSVDNCWERCPSTLSQFISTLRLLYMFARRDRIFVTVAFSLGSCLLLRLCFYLLSACLSAPFY